MLLFCACGSLCGRKLSTQSLIERSRKEKKNWVKNRNWASRLLVWTWKLEDECISKTLIHDFTCVNYSITSFVFHQHYVTKSSFFSDYSIFILSSFPLGVNLRFLCTTSTIFITTSNPVGHYPAPHIYCLFFEPLCLYMSLNSLFSFSLDVWLPVMSLLSCFVIHKSLRYSLLSLSRKLSQR